MTLGTGFKRQAAGGLGSALEAEGYIQFYMSLVVVLGKIIYVLIHPLLAKM